MATLATLACNSGGGGPDGAQSTQTPGTATAEGTQTAPPDTTPPPTLPPDAGPLEQLAAKFLAGVDGKVAYRYVSNFGGHPDGVWSVYRLSGDYRQDWRTNVEGFEASTTIIITGSDFYVCTQATGFLSCGREAEEYARAQVTFFTPVTEVPTKIVEGIQGLESTELPDETIAGVPARCFQVNVPGRLGVGPEGREEIKLCFSADGQLLLMERKVLFDNPDLPAGDLRLEAQEVGAAAAADFQPLAPVP